MMTTTLGDLSNWISYKVNITTLCCLLLHQEYVCYQFIIGLQCSLINKGLLPTHSCCWGPCAPVEWGVGCRWVDNFFDHYRNLHCDFFRFEAAWRHTHTFLYLPLHALRAGPIFFVVLPVPPSCACARQFM